MKGAASAAPFVMPVKGLDVGFARVYFFVIIGHKFEAITEAAAMANGGFFADILEVRRREDQLHEISFFD